MKGWRPVDLIVAFLAATICSVLIMVEIDILINNHELTETGSKMITAIITSILSMLSMYAGAMIQKGKDK